MTKPPLLTFRLLTVSARLIEDQSPSQAGDNTFQTTTVGLNYSLKGNPMKFMVDYRDGGIPGSTLDGGRLITRAQVLYKTATTSVPIS